MKLTGVFLLVLIMFITSCQQKNYVYIVRHAEKSDAPAGDVYLSQQGRNRAHTLKRVLINKKIAYIYTTKFNRTRETAQPLGEELGIPITYYSSDTLGRFVKRCLQAKRNTLIVAHSNTILPIIDSFHVPHIKKIIRDEEYNNLFILTMKKGKMQSCREMTYGKE